MERTTLIKGIEDFDLANTIIKKLGERSPKNFYRMGGTTNHYSIIRIIFT